MLDECPEHKLRAGTKKDIYLMRDFDMVYENSGSSVTGDELRGALDTTWATAWDGLEEEHGLVSEAASGARKTWTSSPLRRRSGPF